MIKKLETPIPHTAANIVTAIRNILKIAMNHKISSISVVLRYENKSTGESVYSTFEEVAPGQEPEFW